MTVLIVKPGEEPYPTEIGSGLSAMQKVVGGPIEAVYPFEEHVALVCHEEGKLSGLPLNRALRCPDTGLVYDAIAGTFFLCAAPPDSENFTSLSQKQIRYYTDRFRNPEFFSGGDE